MYKMLRLKNRYGTCHSFYLIYFEIINFQVDCVPLNPKKKKSSSINSTQCEVPWSLPCWRAKGTKKNSSVSTIQQEDTWKWKPQRCFVVVGPNCKRIFIHPGLPRKSVSYQIRPLEELLEIKIYVSEIKYIKGDFNHSDICWISNIARSMRFLKIPFWCRWWRSQWGEVCCWTLFLLTMKDWLRMWRLETAWNAEIMR